jgi:hypothetical protein
MRVSLFDDARPERFVDARVVLRSRDLLSEDVQGRVRLSRTSSLRLSFKTYVTLCPGLGTSLLLSAERSMDNVI